MIDYKNYETIGFLLDGVLINDLDGGVNPRSEEMQELFKNLKKQGKRVYIYTKRYHQNNGNSYISEENKLEYKVAIDIANKLNANDIIFMDRSNLYHYLSNDNRLLIITPSEYDKVLCEKYKNSVSVVNIKDINNG